MILLEDDLLGTCPLGKYALKVTCPARKSIMACNMNLPQNQRHPPHEKKNLTDEQYTTINEQWMETMAIRYETQAANSWTLA